MQHVRFSGTVVVVTGAGHGIGRAVAERFAQEGARVVVNDVAPSADAAASAIGSAGGEAIGVVADVSNRTDVDRLFEAALDRFGDVNVRWCLRDRLPLAPPGFCSLPAATSRRFSDRRSSIRRCSSLSSARGV
jgi:NAD(P)-dependent dehydrogenase (short-subunit alcohol dehydrogenase family)